jgi:hypothetical protein
MYLKRIQRPDIEMLDSVCSSQNVLLVGGLRVGRLAARMPLI